MPWPLDCRVTRIQIYTLYLLNKHFFME